MKYLLLLWLSMTLSGSLSAQILIKDPLSSPTQLPRAWHPDSIRWDTVFADGSKLAILEGPRDVPGKPFTYAFYLPDGQWVMPHWHCADARVFVVSGTLLLGYGERMDKRKTATHGPGSYVIVPYKTAHYESARGNTTIIGTGTGPWCTYEFPE